MKNNDDFFGTMFDFDGERMLTILTKMENGSYKGRPMRKVVETAIRKVEMSDYMSAYDVVVRWKEQTERGGNES